MIPDVAGFSDTLCCEAHMLQRCQGGTGAKPMFDPQNDGRWPSVANFCDFQGILNEINALHGSINATLRIALDQIIDDAKQQVARTFTKHEGELLKGMHKL